MKEKIQKQLQEVVKKLTGKDIDIQLSIPKDISHGDFTTNVAFQVGKLSGKSPMETAGEIVKEFQKSPTPEVKDTQRENPNTSGVSSNHQSSIINHTFLDRVEVAPAGFINFYLSKDVLEKNLEEVIENPENISTTKQWKNKKVIVEFTDPNPFKEFHIGHVYTNVIGEAIARLYEANGATVQRADYFGDVGMHIAKSIFGLEEKFKEDKIDMSDLAKKSLQERINYFGKAYARGSTIYEEDKAAQEEMKLLNKIIYIASQEMWQKEKGLKPQVDYRKGQAIDEKKLQRVYDLYTVGRKWSLEYFDSIFARLGMKFTGYYPESLAGEKGYALVKEHIKDKVFVEDQGAVVFPGKDHGLHTRVFINSLGLPTYEAKELGLAVWKYDEFPYDFSIIITGSEINEYFKVLMKALSILKPDLAAKSKHLGHGMVKMASGKKMSSRTGQIITGMSVLDEGTNLAKKKIEEAKFSKEETRTKDESAIAEQVGIGAIKYSFLKSGIGKDVPFSFEESVTFDGNSGPYIQYSYVRTQSILSKAGISNFKFQISNNSYVIASAAKQSHIDKEIAAGSSSPRNDTFYSPNPEEVDILRKLYQFPSVVEEAANTYSPNMVCEYLFELSQMFNNFYQKYRILNAEDSSTSEASTPGVKRPNTPGVLANQVRDFRLALTEGVGITLKQGLNLLGIQAPEKM